MKKKIIFIVVGLIILIGICLLIYPTIEIDSNGKLIIFSYSDDISKYEDNACYTESYFYNKEKDISVYNFNFAKFLFFHVITLEYKDGNVCETEYLLEEEYIDNFLKNATIQYNSHNIDLAELIEGKIPIVSNTRYLGNDYTIFIDYVLDGKYEILYIFYVDDLLVIQVGLSDEGPKYIAYK